MSNTESPVMPAKGQKVFSKKTTDGFQNLAMKLGVTGPGQEGGEGDSQNLISGGTYWFNLLTRNRIVLEAAYRGSWIIGRVIDCRAEDMTKAGIILNTSKGAEKINELKVQFSRLQIWQSVCATTKWGALYGGCIGVFQIHGQDLETELDPDTIEKGQFRGIAVYDRWQLNPVLTSVITEGPDIGMPEYYDIVLGSNLNNPAQVTGQGSQAVGAPMSSPTGGRVRVHHSRCFRMGGHKLPFFQAITEMMWDESVVERLWDRLIEFETATASAGGLIGRALLRTVGIDGFREILAAGGEAKDGLISMFEYMRMFQTNEGLTLLDKEDTFQTTAYSFAGLSDMIGQFGEQLSGASEIPLVRLFGQSPSGLGSDGASDIRNYYDGINAKQESTLRNPVELIIKIMWRSLFGEAAPSDLTFKFYPLWQMSDKEKAEIAASKTTAVIAAHQDSLISTATGMKELKQASADTGVFSHITDEEIEEAENEEPPMPDESLEAENEGAETGEPGAGPTNPKEKLKKPVGDSLWGKWFGKRREVKDAAPRRKRKLTRDQKAIREFIK